MRVTSYVLTGAGLALVAYGVYSGVRAAGADDSVDQMGHATWAVAGLVFGAVLIVAARRLWRAIPVKSPVVGPIAGFGRVTAVRHTGITVNGTTSVLEATIDVLAPGVVPFATSIPVRLDRAEHDSVQPGTNVPVLVDRADHSKVELDPARATVPAPR